MQWMQFGEPGKDQGVASQPLTPLQVWRGAGERLQNEKKTTTGRIFQKSSIRINSMGTEALVLFEGRQVSRFEIQKAGSD